MRASVFLSAIALLFSSAAAAERVTVPFVGCPSDGQSGPLPIPKAKRVPVSLPPEIAARLAIYGADYDIGVLAPRGWHCAHLYGSNGAFTVVAEAHISPETLLSDRSIRGPAIQVAMNNGGTSGRFEVARLIARYFPNRRAFLERVIGEGIETAKDFPSGPFKDDQVVSRRRDFIEVVTPPSRVGLGTMSRLVPSALPIHAVAAVIGDADEDWAGYIFSVRLPKEMDDLAPVILRWSEHTYLKTK